MDGFADLLQPIGDFIGCAEIWNSSGATAPHFLNFEDTFAGMSGRTDVGEKIGASDILRVRNEE